MELILLTLLGLGSSAFLIDRLVSNDDSDDSSADDTSGGGDQDPATAPSGLRFEDRPPTDASDDEVGTQSADSLTVQQDLPDGQGLYGLGGDDRLLGDEATDADYFGGSGSDTLIAGGFGQVNGGTGDDVLALSGRLNGFGGAGDDTIFLDPTALVTLSGSQAIVERFSPIATGGSGSDTFAYVTPDGLETGSVSIIRDFDPAEDQLVIDVSQFRQGSDYLLKSTDTSPAADGSYTDLKLAWESSLNNEVLTATIRLDGLASFDPGTLRFVHGTSVDYDPDGNYPVIGDPTTVIFDPGSQGSILTVGTGTDAMAQAGGGDDRVTDQGLGSHAVNLGAGNDSYAGGGGQHRVYGGAGDDDYSLDTGDLYLNPDLVDTVPIGSEMHGGAGNDTLTVVSMGPDAQNAPLPANELLLYGGSGNDHIDTTGGMDHSVAVYGGDGDDLIHIANGQFASGGVGGITPESDQIIVDIHPITSFSQVSTVTGISDSSTVQVNIDASLTGPLQFIDLKAGNGFDVLGTDIYVGNTLVLHVQESDDGDGIGLRQDDPRFAFVRGVAFA